MPTPATQPPRIGLLAGQALERSGLTLPQRAAKCNPLGLVFIYDCISPIIYANKSICQSSLPRHKPLGLVFWQGRCWSEATTLPQSAAKGNPLGLVFQIGRRLSYNQAIIARFVGSAEMLTFAYARARSVLGYIIHLLNLYHND